MRRSNFLVPTAKESPADAEIASHQLMLRAGMIRKSAAGLYTWMPIGLKVLRRVEAVVREEMEKSGAQETLMPVVQAAELWRESGRWELYGPELLRIRDRHDREFCLGPTHEEVITDIVRNTVQSYKALPLSLYQIQTKFRDEIRPRFGIMRAREFTMKDAYSFHIDQPCLEKTYQIMYDAYTNIFSRLGLEFRAVIADTGSIGGSKSHEFHVLADSGEDAIAFSDSSDYAANVEMAESIVAADTDSTAVELALEKVATDNAGSIDEVCKALNLSPQTTVKTLVVKAASTEDDDKNTLITLVLRGDHTLNEIKAEKIEGVLQPLTFASEEEVESLFNCKPGSLGPVFGGEQATKVVVDRHAAQLMDFCCGANEDGFHLIHANWERDVKDFTIADLREVEDGDPSPDGRGHIVIKRGIEVGHIFQLGKKYSQALSATVLNEQGKAEVLTMGCYGIGVSRIVAAAIEQNHDDRGIAWPLAMAPFSVAIIPLNLHKSEQVREASEGIYQSLIEAGVDVLLDDRNERPGVKFADAELIGIPYSVVIGDKSLAKGVVEFKSRSGEDPTDVPPEELVQTILNKLAN